MFDQGNDPNLTPTDTQPPAEEGNNRTFLIAAGILAGVVFLSIVCLAIYALVISPRTAANKASQQATLEAHNQQIAQAMTSTAEVALWTPTELPSPIPTATDTPVVAEALASPTSMYDSLTATMGALYTQAAISQLTPTSTLIAELALPKGGFADEFGIPGLVMMAAVLVVVIFLARRLRTSPVRK
jgi:hypothetical protein